MSESEPGGKVAEPRPEKSQGRNDPKDWEHTGIETLRDPKGGTYGTSPGMDDPEQPKARATPHEKAQSGADVRPDVEQMPESLPEGLQRRRKGPYGKTTGRRQGND